VEVVHRAGFARRLSRPLLERQPELLDRPPFHLAPLYPPGDLVLGGVIPLLTLAAKGAGHLLDVSRLNVRKLRYLNFAVQGV
jgi:hypothetical protein